MVAGSTPVLVGVFLLGVALVIWCVEVFIEAIAESAASLGVSGFFLAVILAGVDLENAVLGVTAAFVSLPDLALGTVFGESLFVLAVAVGLAGLFVPFRVDVPRIYLLMLVLVAVPALAMSVDGTIVEEGGLVLTILFVPLLLSIFWYEQRTETSYMISGEVEEVVDLDDADDSDPNVDESGSRANGGEEDELFGLDLDALVPELEGRSGAVSLGVAVLAIVGLTIGSLITVVSAEQLFVAYGISGLAFGATVLSFIASIEELALTVEPVRRGQPHLAIGNVVGSTVFYMTANVGLIALLHPVDTGGAVMTVHWPFFAACLLVVAALLWRGRVTRFGGAALVGLYVAYWIANYL